MTVRGPGLRRAHDEIRAAHLLAGAGLTAAAVSRSYYAGFYAAEEALVTIGETRSKHSGVVSALGQLVVKQHGLDARAGRLLRSLFDRLSQADYGLTDVPQDEADRAAEDAELVVELIASWIEARPERPDATVS